MPQRPNFAGLVVGWLFFLGSLTPSLLPRPWLYQGIMTGVLVAIGYGVGVSVSHLWRQFAGPEPSARAKRIGWRSAPWVGGASTVLMLVVSYRWQRDLHVLVQEVPPSLWRHLLALPVATGVALALGGLGRFLLRMQQAITEPLSHWIPRRVAGLVSGILTVMILIAFLDGVAGRSLFFLADQVFRTIDRLQAARFEPPSSQVRSGSPASLVDWDDLGSQGRLFVTDGPSRQDLAAFAGGDASEPIRAYAGLTSRDDIDERAALAVDDFERAGGFDRAVVAVMTTTGRGWVDPPLVDALEYLWAGDTATVAMQYSYLPSWLSFLADGTRAREAGRALFEALYARWNELPEAERPLLLVAGESLGADASQAAFSGFDDVRNRTDGALWVGSPNFSPLWDIATSGRQPGSPERLPVYNEGRQVRFVGEPGDLEVDGEWEQPRVVFLQHAADPVVWWSPRLIHRRPDWLEEPRGRDVNPAMRWYPMVTFWQVTADLANSREVPAGHGHNYEALIADAWAAIAPPDGWTEQDTARLRQAVAVED